MKNSVLAVLIAASTALLSIVGLIGAAALRQANRIHEETNAINSAFQIAERSLVDVRTHLDSARVYIRDYMLDPGAESAADLKRSQFRELKSSIDIRLDDLSRLLESEETPEIGRLRAEIDGYFDSFGPILDAGPGGFSGGASRVRKELVSRRDIAVSALQHVGEINEQIYVRKNLKTEEARRSLSVYLSRK